MAVFCLAHLGHNVIPVGSAGRVVITNTSEYSAEVYLYLKEKGAWRPFTGPLTLPPGACLSAPRADLGSGLVRVVAEGRRDGRNIVRVEY
jgi:hypothetical protein